MELSCIYYTQTDIFQVVFIFLLHCQNLQRILFFWVIFGFGLLPFSHNHHNYYLDIITWQTVQYIVSKNEAANLAGLLGLI